MIECNKRFIEHTTSQYPYLKIVGANFLQSEGKLIVKMLYSTAHEGFSDTDRKAVFDAVSSIIPKEVKLEIEYIKTYADEGVVKTKVIQFLNKENSIIFNKLNPEKDILIKLDGFSISVMISATPAFLQLLIEYQTDKKMADFMGDMFVEPIDVSLAEKYIDEGSSELDFINETSSDLSFVADARLIKLTVGQPLYGKGNLNEYPMYISDAKDGFPKAILCGKIKFFDKKMYNNRKFGISDEEKGKRRINNKDEKLPMYKFTLNDTTGSISSVIFPFDNDNDSLELLLQNFSDTSVVCEGSVATDKYSGGLQFAVKRMWRAEIDFGSINTEVPLKKEPVKYHTVIPEKYVEQQQSDMFTEFNEAMGEYGKSAETPDYLKGKTFVVFDLETTGTNVSGDKIVEIGAVKLSNGKLVETFETLVNPQIPIPQGAIDVHHITDADVADAPTLVEVAGDFYKFTRGAIMVAHNIDFDMPMLNNNCKSLGYRFDNDMMDTWQLSRKYLNGKVVNHKLHTICEYLGVSLVNAHRASDDAVACAKCFKYFAKFL